MQAIDQDKLNELIDLMEARGIASLEISSDAQKIKIARAIAQSTPAPIAPAPVATSAPVRAGKTENAPMVGVFYSAPSPNDPPFVKVGQSVAVGDVLGIVEAMKIMNPLEATQSGIIAEILVKNGDVVQYGQPVFRYQD